MVTVYLISVLNVMFFLFVVLGSEDLVTMAFCNKLGNLLRQGATQNKQVPSLLNYVRCMSSSKLFIGGIYYVWMIF